MTQVSLEGLSLMVTDLERSIAFYSALPGAELEMQRPGQFARICFGSGALHLVQLGGKTGFHLEFDTENIEALYEELRGAGFEPNKPQRHPWGKSDFRVIDPDGNTLEFGDNPRQS
ncbi:MAG TPA: VOC family protein [Phototrophicaceae bacterium]|jgi:catechol 2,3-dioxygenase-like lactoylglutathione lyase family enzyme|nr:VOC family protein [Phototrophicaceae bacterium]